MRWQPRTLEEALRPVIWLNFMFGLRVSEKLYVLSIAYNLTLMIIYHLFTYHQMDNMQLLLENTVTFSRIMWLNNGIADVCTIIGWFKNHRMRNVLERLTEVDNTLETFGIRKNYTKVFEISIMTLLLVISAACVRSALFLNRAWNKLTIGKAICVVFLMNLSASVNFIVNLTFIVQLRILCLELHKINNHISEMIKEESTDHDGIPKYQELCRMKTITVRTDQATRKQHVYYFIATMKQIHLELTRILHELNRFYGFQILVQILLYFVLIAAMLTVMYDLILNEQAKKGIEECSLEIFIVALSIGSVYYICYACLSFVNEVENTGLRIYELGQLYADEDIVHEIEQFSLQLMLHPVSFSVHGIKYIDKSFISLFFRAIVSCEFLYLQLKSTFSNTNTALERTNTTTKNISTF